MDNVCDDRKLKHPFVQHPMYKCKCTRILHITLYHIRMYDFDLPIKTSEKKHVFISSFYHNNAAMTG